MEWRAQVRRAFPYLVIAVAGFAVAYVIVFVFVLPSRIVPRRPSARGAQEANTPGDSQGAPSETTLSSPVPFAPPANQAPLPGVVPGAPPNAVQAPDLVQMALSDALAVLHDLQLTARVRRDTSSSQPENTVLSQSPPPGTMLAPGGSVVLTVALFPPLRAASPRDSAARPAPVVPEQPGQPEPQTPAGDSGRHDSVPSGTIPPAPPPPPPAPADTVPRP